MRFLNVTDAEHIGRCPGPRIAVNATDNLLLQQKTLLQRQRGMLVGPGGLQNGCTATTMGEGKETSPCTTD